VDRSDAVAFFEKLHELAPYDCRIANFILEKKYNNHPTYNQAMDLYSNMLSYSLTAITTVANTVYDQPDQYEKLTLQAAQLNPASYYSLGYYYLNRHEEDKAAQYYEQACDNDPDSVRVSNMALWRVRYYLKKGQTDKARQIAADGAEVYSCVGLQAEAIFFEMTGNYDEAFNWFAKNEERYNDSASLIDFCMRYKIKTGNNRFDSEVQKRISKIFPNGMEKVSLKNFSGPPADGVLIRQENDLLTSAGLRMGDVIVAVYGVRVHNFAQYSYGRGLKDTPKLDLIVWQGNTYREFTPAPPNHLFGADFGDYRPQ
jgi:Tfp pilus assembly protein PilF